MKKIHNTLTINISILLTVFLLVSCGSDDESGIYTCSGSIDSCLQGMATLDQSYSGSEPVLKNVAYSEEDGDYICSEKKYEAAAQFDTMLALDPQSDVIWPGSIVEGSSIASGEYAPIFGERGGLSFSISLSNIDGSPGREVSEAKLSNVREAINELLALKVTGSTTAKISFELVDVYSESQTTMDLGISFNYGAHAVNSQFNFSDSNINSRVMLKFLQTYYTLDLDTPNNPGDFFGASVTWDDIQSQVRGMISPAYVSSITYGRLVLFSFESSASRTALKAAVEYAYTAAIGGSVSIAAEYESILNNTTIKATIIGGSASAAVKTIYGYSELKQFIEEGANYSASSPGAPLAYKLRHLSDNSPASVVLTSEYSVRSCHPKTPQYTVTVDRVEATGYEIGAFGVHTKQELFGTIDVYAFMDSTTPIEANGAAGSTVWNKGSSSYVSMNQGDSHTINQDRIFTFPENYNEDNSFIRVTGSIKECDDWPNPEDNLGTISKDIFLRNADGQFSIDGFSDGTQKAKIFFTITPVGFY
ncbi:MAG: hypothetical protein GY754_09590 [bacterium]|nr:hypothetical protein [bacterium]